MPWNPQRTTSAARPSTESSDEALSGFRALTADLRRQVGRGELTLKVARERAAEAAGDLATTLDRSADRAASGPRPFLDRLVATANARARSRANTGLEGLQRETNLLLRRSLVEQQLATRVAEFEGRAFSRPMHGGPPAPTLPGLLAFHDASLAEGDEAATEWTRRQLEALRPRVIEPDDLRKLDRACDRPDRVNPRIVSAYVEALSGRDPAELETFVAQALDGRDASACAAVFKLARNCPEGLGPRWVRATLDGLGEFPDAALNRLRLDEAQSAQADDQTARERARSLAEIARDEARLPDLEAPTGADLARMARVEAKPLTGPDQPIGLALDRRGLAPDEFLASLPATPE